MPLTLRCDHVFLNRLPTRTDTVPASAMVLAAGRGRRMMPLTERVPKPLLEVGGTSVLGQALDRLCGAGVGRIVVNANWLAGQIEDHVRARADERITVSHEAEPLETGGAIVRALPVLGPDPFYVINGDSLWFDGMKCPLLRLAEAWDPARMDILLLLASLARTEGFRGTGDFLMDPDGRLERAPEGIVVPYAYMGLAIVAPAALENPPPGAFSLNLAFDRAQETGRLHGLLHDGLWYHISTPEDLATARARTENGHGPAVPFF